MVRSLARSLSRWCCGVWGCESGGYIGWTAYHDRAFSPPAIPVPADETDPFPLAPNAGPDANLGIQLHAHLKVALERRLWNRKAPGAGTVALEAVEHDVVVAFLGGAAGGFGARWRVGGRAVDGFVQDRVVGVVLFHSVKVGGAFEKVDALAGGVFGTDGLAVDALGGEALGGVSGGIVGLMEGCEDWNGSESENENEGDVCRGRG